MTADETRDVAARFLAETGRTDDFVGVFWLEDGKPRHHVVRADDAPRLVAKHADRDVFMSVGTMARPPAGAGRGDAEDVTALPVLWCDLDVKPGGMPSAEAAREVIAELSDLLGVLPCAVVATGHGVHPYWRIEDDGAPWDAAGRAHAAMVVKRFGALVARVAARHGGARDSVFDLARVMRAPGTRNRKAGGDVLVTVDYPGGAATTLALVADVLDAHEVTAEHTATAAPAGVSPDFLALPPAERERLSRWTAAAVEGVRTQLRAAAGWPAEYRDERGRGWQKLTADAALRLGSLARAPWCPLTDAEAADALAGAAPTDATWTRGDVTREWRKQHGRGEPAAMPAAPPSVDAEDESVELAALELSEAVVAERCAAERLAGRFVWVAGLGWHRWDGRRWAGVSGEVVVEAVRGWLRDLAEPLLVSAAEAPHDPLKKAAGTAAARLLRRNGVEAVASLARGLVAVSAGQLDARPDLLNVGNGVVDLRTGELAEHDPALLLTKLAPVEYVPDASSPDWTAALAALPADAAEWLAVRLGQAATGYTPPDDRMLVAHGGGENGKTTVLNAVMRTLGDYSTVVSDRVLLASPDAHPTELMELRGARLAVIEETPEARRLNVTRLKKIVGTPQIEARRIRQDSVTFDATHALLVTSNYRPSVEETDHGTWRRLALVPFPFTFVKAGQPLRAEHERHGDPGLRERIATAPEARSAVLAWLVEGARRWYAAERVMPELPASVATATRAWRVESDVVLGYLDDALVPEHGRHVMAADLLADLNEYLRQRGMQPWSEKTVAARFGDHGEVRRLHIEAGRQRPGPGLSRRPNLVVAPPPARYRAWSGVRFRTAADEAADALASTPPPLDAASGGDW